MKQFEGWATRTQYVNHFTFELNTELNTHSLIGKSTFSK